MQILHEKEINTLKKLQLKCPFCYNWVFVAPRSHALGVCKCGAGFIFCRVEGDKEQVALSKLLKHLAGTAEAVVGMKIARDGVFIKGVHKARVPKWYHGPIHGVSFLQLPPKG